MRQRQHDNSPAVAKPIPMSLAEHILKRTTGKIRQTASSLADDAGVDRATISGIVHGRIKTLSYQSARGLQKVLGLTQDEMDEAIAEGQRRPPREGIFS